MIFQKRNVLEETNQLEPRISGLDEEVGMESDEEEEIDHKVRILCQVGISS